MNADSILHDAGSRPWASSTSRLSGARRMLYEAITKGPRMDNVIRYGAIGLG